MDYRQDQQLRELVGRYLGRILETPLHAQKVQQWQELKLQFSTTCESLKPINLLKSALQEAQKDPDLKKQVLHTALDLGINYLIKKANAFTANFSGLDFLKNIYKKNDE